NPQSVTWTPKSVIATSQNAVNLVRPAGCDRVTRWPRDARAGEARAWAPRRWLTPARAPASRPPTAAARHRYSRALQVLRPFPGRSAPQPRLRQRQWFAAYVGVAHAARQALPRLRARLAQPP